MRHGTLDGPRHIHIIVHVKDDFASLLERLLTEISGVNSANSSNNNKAINHWYGVDTVRARDDEVENDVFQGGFFIHKEAKILHLCQFIENVSLTWEPMTLNAGDDACSGTITFLSEKRGSISNLTLWSSVSQPFEKIQLTDHFFTLWD